MSQLFLKSLKYQKWVWVKVNHFKSKPPARPRPELVSATIKNVSQQIAWKSHSSLHKFQSKAKTAFVKENKLRSNVGLWVRVSAKEIVTSRWQKEKHAKSWLKILISTC